MSTRMTRNSQRGDTHDDASKLGIKEYTNKGKSSVVDVKSSLEVEAAPQSVTHSGTVTGDAYIVTEQEHKTPVMGAAAHRACNSSADVTANNKNIITNTKGGVNPSLDMTTLTVMLQEMNQRILELERESSKSRHIASVGIRSMRPSMQIAKGSCLADAIEQARKISRQSEIGADFSHAPNDLLPEEAIDSSSYMRYVTYNNYQESNNNAYIRMKHGIKPIPPKSYDGTPDITKFYSFVIQTKQFMVDTGLDKEPGKQVGRMADFLTGNAMAVYMQDIFPKRHLWTLEKFYVHLMDCCFPPNYAFKQRRKFNNTRQGNRSVRDFCHELQMLSTILGDIPERFMVFRLYEGTHDRFKPEIWKCQINPEMCSFEEIKEALILIESYEEVALRETDRSSRRSRASRATPNPPNSSQHRSRRNNLAQNRIYDRSVSKPSSKFHSSTET